MLPLALEQAAVLPTALALVMAAGLVASWIVHFAHAKNNETLASEAEVTEEALHASAHVLQKVLAGVPVEQAIEELPHDPEAVDAFKRVWAYVSAKFKSGGGPGGNGGVSLAVKASLLVFALSLGAVGCSLPELQGAEATAKAKVGAAADNVQALSVAVDSHEASIVDLAKGVQALAALVSSSSPQAAADLEALAGAAQQAPGVAAQVGAYAGTVKAALK